MNIMFKDGEEFMTKFGYPWLLADGQNLGFTDVKIEKMRSECVKLFDKLSGSKTTDLRTFGIAVVVAYKN